MPHLDFTDKVFNKNNNLPPIIGLQIGKTGDLKC